MVKQLKDYQLQSENVLIVFCKAAVVMPLKDQTELIKKYTKFFPLSSIKEAAFFNTNDKN